MCGGKCRNLGIRGEAPVRMCESDYLNGLLWTHDVTPIGVAVYPECNNQGQAPFFTTGGGNQGRITPRPVGGR